MRQAVLPALHADGPFVVRTGDTGVDGDLAWALEESARADADAAVDQSVAGETATDTGIVTVDTDDRVTGIKLNPPDIPLSDGGRFSA